MTDAGFRYDGAAIDQMKGAVNILYEIWLELATKHTRDQGRAMLMPTDAKATLAAAVNKWLVEGPR